MYIHLNKDKSSFSTKKIRHVYVPDRFQEFCPIHFYSSVVRSASFTGTPSGLSEGDVVLGVFLGKEGYTGGSKISFPVAGIAGSPRWRAMVGSGLGSTMILYSSEPKESFQPET